MLVWVVVTPRLGLWVRVRLKMSSRELPGMEAPGEGSLSGSLATLWLVATWFAP